MNKFGIPAEIESAIRARDVECVYCQKAMVPPTSTPNRANWATIEHLDHLPPFPYREGQTADDFAIACGSCNSSRRDKPLWVFIAKRGIADTIAPVIRAFLGRAKATEVLVQQEFVNLLTSRPQVNGTNRWRSLKSELGVLFQPFKPAWLDRVGPKPSRSSSLLASKFCPEPKSFWYFIPALITFHQGHR
jgi:hypothetical protein